jgi:hypothetical protein
MPMWQSCYALSLGGVIRDSIRCVEGVTLLVTVLFVEDQHLRGRDFRRLSWAEGISSYIDSQIQSPISHSYRGAIGTFGRCT